MEADDLPLVILVGGDARTRAMLRFLIQEVGCAVVEVADAATASSAQNAALLAVIGGYRDDEMLDAVARLRRTPRCPAILLLSRGNGRDLRRRAFALGVADVVTLPAAAPTLQERVRPALGDRARPLSAGGIGTVVKAGGLTLDITMGIVRDDTGWRARLTHQGPPCCMLGSTRPARSWTKPELT